MGKFDERARVFNELVDEAFNAFMRRYDLTELADDEDSFNKLGMGLKTIKMLKDTMNDICELYDDLNERTKKIIVLEEKLERQLTRMEDKLVRIERGLNK